MTSQVEAVVGLELKYCEQCGGLWLRRRGSSECYCAGCVRFLEEMPPRVRDNRRRGGSGPLRRRMKRQVREPGTELAPLEYIVARTRQEELAAGRAAGLPLSLQAVAEQEVNAHDGM